MRYLAVLVLAFTCHALAAPSQTPFTLDEVTPLERETIPEAARHARQLISHRSDGIGTLISVFPNDTSLEGPHLGGRPTPLARVFCARLSSF